MSEQRGQEHHDIEHISDMVDHISNLPDSILQHILSFMHTQEVVKTSILSTRWKNLWVSVPNIEFDDRWLWARKITGQCPYKVTSFMNFLEKVFRLRGESNIERFRLTCYDSCDESEIPAWISDAIMHNVQELDLTLFQEDPFVIPWSMLDGTSLVSLKITTHHPIELPSCISFPCLITLHLLFFLVFSNDDHAEKILLGCPVALEELVLSDCNDKEELLLGCPILEELVLTYTNRNWMNLKNIVISSFTLKSLTIEELGKSHDPSGRKIEIYAVNLTYFKYTGYLSNEIILNNVLSLVKACIYIPTLEQRQKEVACRVIDLFKQLRYVVSLTLSGSSIEFLRFAYTMLVHFPVFPNLSHLKLEMRIGNYDFGALMDFLNSCPMLQSICLSEGFEYRMCLDENDPIWLSIPICMSNCLKTVTFKNFKAYNSEVCFLKGFLKYAPVLEMMDIWWSKIDLPDLKKKTEARNKLETLERSSTTCVIKFT